MQHNANAPIRVPPGSTFAAESNAAAATPAALRLFFALWPSAALRHRLAQHQALWRWVPPARPLPAAKLHLTLLFMPAVAQPQVPALLQAAATVAQRGQAFELLLDRAAVWQHGGIAHLAPSSIPPALVALQAALAGEAARCGVVFDTRPYAPHVTLARRAERQTPPAAFAPLRWAARDVALVQSALGTGRYTVLARWPLGRAQ